MAAKLHTPCLRIILSILRGWSIIMRHTKESPAGLIIELDKPYNDDHHNQPKVQSYSFLKGAQTLLCSHFHTKLQTLLLKSAASSETQLDLLELQMRIFNAVLISLLRQRIQQYTRVLTRIFNHFLNLFPLKGKVLIFLLFYEKVRFFTRISIGY